MQLSRTVEYALHAALQLARNTSGDPVSSSKLAASGVMPERFLLQVLRLLVTHGLLRSTRGVDGGYALARDPAQITLLDVIEAVEGPLLMKQPSLQTLPEPTWSRLRAVLNNGVAAVRAEYSKLTLAQILSDAHSSMPETTHGWRVTPEPPSAPQASWETPAPAISHPADPGLDSSKRTSA